MLHFCVFIFTVYDMDFSNPGDNIKQVTDLTCHCNQCAKKLDQGQNKGNAKITRKREEKRISICLHRMLKGQENQRGNDMRCCNSKRVAFTYFFTSKIKVKNCIYLLRLLRSWSKIRISIVVDSRQKLYCNLQSSLFFFFLLQFRGIKLLQIGNYLNHLKNIS